MLGVSLVVLRVFWGLLFVLSGYAALALVRKRAPKR